MTKLNSYRDGLLFLLERGADAYAKTFKGVSVSEIAYTSRFELYLGSYIGDLWDSVLALSGYEVVDFRRGFPRKGIYKHHYTREIFEQLWSGNENLCPYYDDAAVDTWVTFSDGDDGAHSEYLELGDD